MTEMTKCRICERTTDGRPWCSKTCRMTVRRRARRAFPRLDDHDAIDAWLGQTGWAQPDERSTVLAGARPDQVSAADSREADGKRSPEGQVGSAGASEGASPIPAGGSLSVAEARARLDALEATMP